MIGSLTYKTADTIRATPCAHERLISAKFGRVTGQNKEVKAAADEIYRNGIFEMLKLEAPNLHEIGLDRVIAYRHTWSRLHDVGLLQSNSIEHTFLTL